jgi:hypothetical protein
MLLAQVLEKSERHSELCQIKENLVYALYQVDGIDKILDVGYVDKWMWKKTE